MSLWPTFWHILYNNRLSLFSKPSDFGEKKKNFDRVNPFCISQRSVMTFLDVTDKGIISCQVFADFYTISYLNRFIFDS